MAGVLAATLVEPGRIELREYPRPEPEPGAVIVRVVASGICGTDKHTFRGETEQYAGTAHARSTPFPIIQGHENVGVVEAVGEGGALAWDGTELRPGDRIVPAPNRPCGSCRFCRGDFPYYLCERLENYGNSLTSAEPPHLFGGWAELLYVRSGTPVFRVPDGLPAEVAVLTELMAVTHSLDLAAQLPRPGGFRPGDSVAVVGIGPLGLVHVAKAALVGAGRVTAIDPVAPRRALALELGADEAAAPGEVESGFDVVVDASGHPDSFLPSIALLRDGGTLVEVGAFVDMGPTSFNPAVLCARNLTLLGVGGEDARAYEPALRLLARHHRHVPFGHAITHRFPVRRAAEAIETALRADGSMKVVIEPQRSD